MTKLQKEISLIIALLVIAGMLPVFAANNPYLGCPDCNSTNNIQQTPSTTPSKIPNWIKAILKTIFAVNHEIKVSSSMFLE